MNVRSLFRSSTVAKPTVVPAAKKERKRPGVVPDGFITYFVLTLEPDGSIAYEGICVSRKPKGTPQEVGYALASMLGIEGQHVLGVLRADEGVRVRVAHDGMEFRFSNT